MLPGEADAAVHLHVELGAQVGGRHGQRRRHRRGATRTARRPPTRRGPRPTPRPSPARWPRACWRSGASPPGTWRSGGRTARRSLAYAAAGSVHSRATPTASAAKIVRAMSTSACRAPGRTSAAAPSKLTRPARRVGSRFGGDSTVTPPARRVDDGDVVADADQQHVGQAGADHRPGRTVQRRRRGARRRRRGRPRRTSIRRRDPGSSLAARSSDPAATSTALAIDRRHEGAGCHRPAELLDDDDQLLQPVPGAAVLLGDVQARATRGAAASA